MGDPQTGEQYQRSSHTVAKVLNSTSGFPAWGSDKGTGYPQGIWPWVPVRFDYRTSRGLMKTETPVLQSTSKLLCTPRPRRRKEQWPHSWLNQNHLLVSEGLLWRNGSTGAHNRDRGTGRSPLVQTLLEFAINPTIDFLNLRAGSPQPPKKTTREGVQTYSSPDN